MNILQAIWHELMTPNEGITGILFNDLGIPIIFIELTVNMLLFTTILDIKATLKRKYLYVLVAFFVSCCSNLLFDKPISSYINMLAYPVIIYCIFNTSILKSVFAALIPIIISTPLELLFVKFFSIIFNTTYENSFPIPLYRIYISLTIYLIMFIIFLLIKRLKYKFIFSDELSTKNKIVIFINSIIGILIVCTQFYVFCYYSSNLPFLVCLLSILGICAYFFISIFSLFKTTKLELTSQDLEQAQDYNNTLKLLYDDIRTFRHDFGNIMQAINGYIDTNNMDGLKKYYKQLQLDCEDVKSLEMLNPTIIDSPAVYSILTSKFHKASDLGITMKIHISLKLSTLNMKVYEFTRILGILLDNAIEACEKCDDKIINLEIRRDEKSPRQLLLIQNTYYNKDVDLERINEKGYTSKSDKSKPHGLGLWEVQKLLKKSKNLNLYTTKDSLFFTQQLEIYDK